MHSFAPAFRLRRVWIYTVLAGGWLALVCAGRLAAAPVSYEEAAKFSLELRTAFAEKRGEALLARLDSEGMRRRTFGPLGPDSLHAPEAHQLWRKTLWPVILEEMQPISGYVELQPDRVLLLENDRVLECVLLTEGNEFSIVQLWLGKSAESKVTIQDVRFLTTQLEMSRRLRQTLLMFGVPATSDLDEEDRDVAYLASSSLVVIKQAFSSLQEKNPENAFRNWNFLPDRLKAKPIWHDVRNTIALAGSKAAAKQQQEQYHSGQLTNSFYRFILARKLGATEDATLELEGMIQRYHNQPFLRVVRADLLMQAGHHADALAASREVYRYYPYMNSAYLTALQAALGAGKREELPAILDDWALLMTLETIEQQLKLTPELEKVAATPEFVAWKKARPSAPPS